MNTKKNRLYLTMNLSNLSFYTIGAFIVFFLFGFADNIKSPTMPPILKEFNFNYTSGGTIFLGAYFGFFVAVIFAGLLSSKIGNQKVITLGIVLLLTGLIFYSYSTTLFILTSSMIIIGMGLGVFEVSVNSFIIEIHGENNKSGKYLLLIGFFHSIGSMIAPLFAGQLIKNNYSWQNIYRLTAVLALIAFLYFILLKQRNFTIKNTNKISISYIKHIIFSKNMAYFYILILSYVGIELGIGSWIVEYLQKTKHQSISLSTISTSAFFGCIMIGRFIGSFIIEKIGYIKIMILCVIFSLISLFIGLIGPDNLFFFIPLTGVFLSVIFPTTTALVSKISNNGLSLRLGTLFAFAGIGGMIGPWILGLMGDMLNIGVSFAIVNILLSFIMLFSLFKIRKLPEFNQIKQLK